MTDHWGFWNNRDSNKTTDKEKDYVSNIDVYKAANPAIANIGLLSKITYPTGGTEEYLYEPNSYSISYKYNFDNHYWMSAIREDQGGNRTCGGARVSRIRTFDGLDTRERKIIYATKRGISTGVVGVMPQYKFEEAFKKIILSYPSYEQYQREICDKSTVSRGVNMDNLLGEYHIGYSNVYEEFDDGSYNHYTYSTWKEYPNSNTPSSLFSFENFDQTYAGLHTDYQALINNRTDSMKLAVAWKYGLYRLSDNSMKRGLLQTKNTYYANGALAETVKYTYTPATETKTIKCTASNRNGEVSYDINIGANLLSKEVHTYYPDPAQSSDTISLRKYYSYNKNNQLIKEKTEDSSGQSISLIYDYVTNYTRQQLPDAMGKMQDLNMVQQPIGTYNINEDTLVDAVKYSYTTERDIPLLKQVYCYNAPDAANYSALISPVVDATKYKLLKQITIYNEHNRPVEFEEYETATPTVLIWGYNGRYIIAKIQNARLSTVNSLLGIETQNRWLESTPSENDFTLLNSLRRQLPEAHVSTYKYLAGVGITQQTDPSGRATYYEYDEANRLCRITDDHQIVVKEYEYHYSNPQIN